MKTLVKMVTTVLTSSKATLGPAANNYTKWQDLNLEQNVPRLFLHGISSDDLQTVIEQDFLKVILKELKTKLTPVGFPVLSGIFVSCPDVVTPFYWVDLF